jgi:N-acetylmuramoyl-L-alanine amidase
MRIRDHWLVGDPGDRRILPRALAQNIDEQMAPDLVVLHDTASPIEKGNVARFLQKSRKVSVHFVIERDGSVEQQAPTNRACDHAGQSHYHARDGVNAFSLGIELVNPGRMEAGPGGRARSWWGEEFDIEQCGIQWLKTPEHGAGYWMPHTEAQVTTLVELLLALIDGVPKLRDIRGHWYVSPGRKIDPGPHLPIEALRGMILGRTDPAEEEAGAETRGPRFGYEYVQVATGGSNLNMRRWLSFNPNVIGSIPNGTVVPVIASGMFGGRRWEKVQHDGREGWVVASYTFLPEDRA